MKELLRLCLLSLMGSLVLAVPTRADDAKPSAKNPAPELNDRTLQTLLDTILPKKGELRWQAIPWRVSFWEAVVQGAKADKPILLWTMNSNPLGCT